MQSTVSATTASGALKRPLSWTFWRKSFSHGSVQFIVSGVGIEPYVFAPEQALSVSSHTFVTW